MKKNIHPDLVYSSILLGISVGIQWIMTALLIIGLHPRSRSDQELTDVGKYWVRPEYDVIVYIVGCLLTQLLIIVLYAFRNKRLKNNRNDVMYGFDTSQIYYAVASFIIQLLLIAFYKITIFEIWKFPISYLYKVALTGIWVVILATPGSITLLKVFMKKN